MGGSSENKIELLYYTDVPILGIYPMGCRSARTRDACTPMFYLNMVGVSSLLWTEQLVMVAEIAPVPIVAKTVCGVFLSVEKKTRESWENLAEEICPPPNNYENILL
jgi:hypothetical protein